MSMKRYISVFHLFYFWRHSPLAEWRVAAVFIFGEVSMGP